MFNLKPINLLCAKIGHRAVNGPDLELAFSAHLGTTMEAWIGGFAIAPILTQSSLSNLAAHIRLDGFQHMDVNGLSYQHKDVNGLS